MRAAALIKACPVGEPEPIRKIIINLISLIAIIPAYFKYIKNEL